METSRDLERRVSVLCAQLRAEPLFHVSLGSKELFHSNFIAWFADTFPTLAAAAFATWTRPVSAVPASRTDREVAHLDLVLHLPGLAPVAIENMVFSVPDETQLDRYAALFEGTAGSGEKPSKVLLSLMSPGWPDGTYHSWVLRTYGDLAAALGTQAASVSAADTFAGDLIDHYVRLIGLLRELMDLLGTPAPDLPLLLEPAIVQELELTRISAGVQKARASHVARALRQQVVPKWADIEVDHGFTNGRSLLQAFRRLPAEDGAEPDWIGWQLRGMQFRLAVMTGAVALRGGEHRSARERYVLDKYAGWFDFGPLAEVSGEPSAARTAEVRGGRWAFQGYNPNFVYRYRPGSALTSDQLVTLGITYLERAEHI